MLRRGAAVLLAVALGSLGPGAMTRSYASRPHVTFSTDWTADCSNCTVPLVSGGTIFTLTPGPGDGAATLRTFDAATGAPGWSRHLGTVVYATVAAVDHGVVYLGEQLQSGRARVVALDAADGSPRFRAGVPRAGLGPQFPRVAVDASGVYAVADAEGSQDLAVTRFDTNGAVVWTRRQHRSAGAFALSGGKVYAFSSLVRENGDEHDLLTAYDETDGSSSLLWQTRGYASFGVQEAVVVQGVVYAVQYTWGAGTGFGTVAIDATSGALLWQYRSQADTFAIGGGVLVAGAPIHDDPTTLTGLDPRTGAVRWGPGENTGGNPTIMGDVVYSSAFGIVYARSLESGKIEGKFKALQWPHAYGLAAAGGHVYARSDSVLMSLTPTAS